MRLLNDKMDYEEFERLGVHVGDVVAVTYTLYGRISHNGGTGNYYNLAVGLFSSANAGDDLRCRYPVLTLCSIIQRGSEVLIPMYTSVGDGIHPVLPCSWRDIKSVQKLKTREEMESMLKSAMPT